MINNDFFRCFVIVDVVRFTRHVIAKINSVYQCFWKGLTRGRHQVWKITNNVKCRQYIVLIVLCIWNSVLCVWCVLYSYISMYYLLYTLFYTLTGTLYIICDQIASKHSPSFGLFFTLWSEYMFSVCTDFYGCKWRHALFKMLKSWSWTGG